MSMKDDETAAEGNGAAAGGAMAATQGATVDASSGAAAAHAPAAPTAPGGEVLAEALGPDGESLVLRRAAGGFEIVRDGRVAIASAERRSERELVNIGLVPLRDRHDITVLVGGLGMGYVVAALLDSPRVVRVDVVEHSAAIVEWNRRYFAPLHRIAPLDDPRVHVHTTSFAEYLRAVPHGAVPGLTLEGGGYLAVILDLDDGPSALSRGKNADLYTDDGLVDLEGVLRPGGVLALWAAQREPELLGRIHGRFQNIAEIAVPVDVPSSSGLDYLYRARKRAQGSAAIESGSGGGGAPPRGRAQA